MRKCLLGLAFIAIGSTSALAKPVVYNWTGGYIGAHIGGVWGDVDVKDDIKDGVLPGPFGYSVDGVFGGGTAGYNLQFDNFVIGIEGDLGFIDPNGSGIIPSSNPIYHQDITLDSGLYGDITGRLGVTFDGLLIYAKGGFAFFDGEAKQATTKPGYAPTGTDTFSGWTLGGGAEYFLTRSISLKAEYLHFEFGTQRAYQTTTVADPPTPVGYQFNNWHDVSFDSVKAGIAYHF